MWTTGSAEEELFLVQKGTVPMRPLLTLSQVGYELWCGQMSANHQIFWICRVDTSTMQNPTRSARCGTPDRLGKNFFSAKKQGGYEATFLPCPRRGMSSGVVK
jgi:hypothetical protein